MAGKFFWAEIFPFFRPYGGEMGKKRIPAKKKKMAILKQNQDEFFPGEGEGGKFLGRYSGAFFTIIFKWISIWVWKPF